MSDADFLDDFDLGESEGGEATTILLSDPDITVIELEAVAEAMQAPRLSSGPLTEQFEAEFAAYLGRRYAVAVPSGTLGLLYTLKAYGIGPGTGDRLALFLPRGGARDQPVRRAAGVRRYRLLGGNPCAGQGRGEDHRQDEGHRRR